MSLCKSCNTGISGLLKCFLFASFTLGTLTAISAPRPANIPFAAADDLNYQFLPKQKITFINGVVKNKEATALPDIDAQYSNKVRVDNMRFTLPGELCETMCACYKADLKGDQQPDYVFVNIDVWNGRYAGHSQVWIFVSTPQKKYVFNSFEARHLEAALENGKVMLIKYDYSDDDESYIRQYYTFDANGKLRLHQAEKFVFQSDKENTK